VKFRTTGILLIVFVLLMGYVYVWELNKFGLKKTSEPAVDKSTWVLTLGKDDVQELRVQDGEQSIVLARSGESWSIGAIGGEEADAVRVNSIVNSLVDLRSTRVLTQTAEDISAFGLDNPKVLVTVGLEGGKQEVLHIGNKTIQGTGYYVQRKGYDPIYIIASYLVDDLKRLVSEPPHKPTPTPAPTPAPGTASEGTPGAEATTTASGTPTP